MHFCSRVQIDSKLMYVSVVHMLHFESNFWVKDIANQKSDREFQSWIQAEYMYEELGATDKMVSHQIEAMIVKWDSRSRLWSLFSSSAGPLRETCMVSLIGKVVVWLGVAMKQWCAIVFYSFVCLSFVQKFSLYYLTWACTTLIYPLSALKLCHFYAATVLSFDAIGAEMKKTGRYSKCIVMCGL